MAFKSEYDLRGIHILVYNGHDTTWKSEVNIEVTSETNYDDGIPGDSCVVDVNGNILIRQQELYVLRESAMG